MTGYSWQMLQLCCLYDVCIVLYRYCASRSQLFDKFYAHFCFISDLCPIFASSCHIVVLVSFVTLVTETPPFSYHLVCMGAKMNEIHDPNCENRWPKLLCVTFVCDLASNVPLIKSVYVFVVFKRCELYIQVCGCVCVCGMCAFVV